jgi:hypothetical protein
VRSNTFVDRPWQLREFKTNINTKGEAVFVADSVKSNPVAELFAKQGDLDSNALKDLRAEFERASVLLISPISFQKSATAKQPALPFSSSGLGYLASKLRKNLLPSVADFWKEIGEMSKTDALVQLEKFFYQGLEHKGVQLPAAINFVKPLIMSLELGLVARFSGANRLPT